MFIPTTFLGGITGQLYRQFALTIAATALLSAINALTLKPAQCALWLRPVKENHKKFFLSRWFNTAFGWVESTYTACVAGMIRVWPIMLLIFVATLGGTVWWYQQVPTGFLPTEDQGYLIGLCSYPMRHRKAGPVMWSRRSTGFSPNNPA